MEVVESMKNRPRLSLFSLLGGLAIVLCLVLLLLTGFTALDGWVDGWVNGLLHLHKGTKL